MINLILRNPLTRWIKQFGCNLRLIITHFNSNLKLDLSSSVTECSFGNFNTIYARAVLNRVSLGDYTYVARDTYINNATIGKFASIGPEVLIGLGMHPSRSFVSTHPSFFSPFKQAQITFVDQSLFEEYSPIVIGNDVWIGARAIIFDGLKIGDGAIVGAGALVTKDVPPYSIVAGVPATILRYRFDEEVIDYLMKLKWWDKGAGWLHENGGSFRDLHHFMKNQKSEATS